MLSRSFFRFDLSTRRARGVDFLRNRFTNKASCFTQAEREHLSVVGLLPPAVETIEDQVERCWSQFKLLSFPINKYQLLRGLLDTNVTLYYKFIETHMKESLPIIYTPTVGEACQRYGAIYQKDHGLYIGVDDIGKVAQSIKNLRKPRVDVIVITDGSRILGLGDLGANGIGISIGKCSLYVAAGGIKPSRVLPVMLDVGTNNPQLRNDPLYLGSRRSRVKDETFYALLDEFMENVKNAWPNAVVQFEDFSNNHCFDMLERYQNKYRCFNDDIQGTGAVIAAGFLNAIKASGVPAKDHRVVFFGAGSAAVGVADSITQIISRKCNLPLDEVKKGFYLVDSKGLVTTTRGDQLASHKNKWARCDITSEQSASLKTLMDVVSFVKPTALIGLGAVTGAFTENIIREMAKHTARPIIFPLSNPSSKAEITPNDAYHWTAGAAIVASGSPFPSSVVDGQVLTPSQGNNLYIFPGIGLGASVALPPFIPQDVLNAAADALSEMVDESDIFADGRLYPPIDKVKSVSKNVAVAVIEELQKLGLAKKDLPDNKPQLKKIVQEAMWQPKYLDTEYYLSQKFDSDE